MRQLIPILTFCLFFGNEAKAQNSPITSASADSILVIIEEVELYPDKVEYVVKQFPKLVSETRKEEGCLKYDLHRDIENDNVFWFYEHWLNTKSQQKHMNSAHLKEYLKATEGMIKELTLHQMRLQPDNN